MSDELNPVEAFYFEHAAGWSYDPETETSEQGRINCARELAAAANWAALKGYWPHWQIDTENDSSTFSDERPAWQLWELALIGPDGKVAECMGAIDFGRGGDPSDPYARVCVAQLAIDARAAVGE